MDKRTSKVMSSALEKLSDDLILRCLEDEVFVTQIIEPDADDGVVLIDFKNSIPDSYEKFVEMSKELYDNFYSIKTWYNA